MAQTIKLRRSALAGAVPTTEQLQLGEIAINTRDGKLFIKQSDGTTEQIIELGTGGGGGNTSIAISPTAPTIASVGNLWWDSNQGKLKIYYNDGNTSQWVDASSNTYGNGEAASFGVIADAGIEQLIVSGDNINFIGGNGVNTSTGTNSVTFDIDTAVVATVNSLSAVATSGDYSDLINTPALFSGSYTDLTNKPTLFSGSYTDLTNKPTLATVATSGSYTDLTNKPTLATVATSGSYSDLTGTPTLATVATSGDYDDLINSPALATVATSGAYSDLSGKPTLLSIVDVATATGDIHGIVDRTASTLSFDDATRTLTIAPTSGSWDFYYKGTLYSVSSTKSITIANTSGSRFIKLDPTTLTLIDGGPIPDFVNDIVIAYIYYDTSSAKALIVGDERHGSKRDTTWHSNQHLNVGTVWRSGGAVSYTLNNDAAITVEVGSPIAIADEDLLHTITHAASPNGYYQQVLTGAASLEVVYLNGTTYTSTAQSTVPWIAGTSFAKYNQITNGSGTLIDATEGAYITYWLLATNDIRRPVKLVLGREAHASLDAAYAESFTEYGLSFAEQVFMYQIVVQTKASYSNTPKIAIAGVRKITTKLSDSVASLPATSHSNLTGRDTLDAHPLEAITGLSSALANAGTVKSISGTGTVAGITLSGTVTNTGNLTLGGTLSTPINTINDSTTVGQNLVKLTNPSAITFLRVNADNTVSSLDASTFRTAIGAGTGNGTVTSVTGTAPISSTGGTTPAISIPAASSSVNGYLTSTDWNTFNNKQKAITVGTTAPTSPSIGDLWVDTN